VCGSNSPALLAQMIVGAANTAISTILTITAGNMRGRRRETGHD